MTDLLTAVAGLAFGLSLIVAIGAQNTFVLRQGLRREHVALVVAVCAGSDVVLITAGVGGLGTAIHAVPWLLPAVRLAGAAFLLTYAALAARRAIRNNGAALNAAAGSVSLTAALATSLALTWLNPHVYLDTVVLLGSVAASHGSHRWWFAVGAIAASLAWFTALGYGAALLRPLFTHPRSWRYLDAAVALLMLVLAASLLLQLRA